MRDQTCAPVLGVLHGPIRTACLLVKQGPPLRRALLAAIALTLGGWIVWKLFSITALSDSESSDAMPVLVAQEYIAAFTPLKPGMVSLKSFPRHLAPPGAFHSAGELTDENGRNLFASAIAVPEGQPLTRSILTEMGKSSGLASLLPNGKVAVSFSVDRVRGAGGWVKPGDVIAIFETRRDLRAGIERPASLRLLYPAVPVLAVDTQRLGDIKTPKDATGLLDEDRDHMDGTASVITVPMNLVEVPALILAQDEGHLTITLRAVGDDLSEVPHGK